jgi:hypothetical protein
MIQSAVRLAKTLADRLRAAQLERLHLEIESRLRDMEINKNFLENKLDEQLQAVSEHCKICLSYWLRENGILGLSQTTSNRVTTCVPYQVLRTY